MHIPGEQKISAFDEYFSLIDKVNSILKGLNDAKDLLYIFQFISITPLGHAHEWK